MSRKYQRTPLPKSCSTPMGLSFLGWLLVIFGPFFGFAVHGRVDSVGMDIGANFSLAGAVFLVLLFLRKWHAWRQLSQSIRDEWRRGKVILPVSPRISLTEKPFKIEHQNAWCEFRPEGVTFSESHVLSIHGLKDIFERISMAKCAGQYFIAWDEVRDCVVESDSDGPDYYDFNLKPKGRIRIKSLQPPLCDESVALDLISNYGNIPIIIRRDV